VYLRSAECDSSQITSFFDAVGSVRCKWKIIKAIPVSGQYLSRFHVPILRIELAISGWIFPPAWFIIPNPLIFPSIDFPVVQNSRPPGSFLSDRIQMNIDSEGSRYHLPASLLERAFDQEAIFGTEVAYPCPQHKKLRTETWHWFDSDHLAQAFNGMVDSVKTVALVSGILWQVFGQYQFFI
jgi:hypothetical protein